MAQSQFSFSTQTVDIVANGGAKLANQVSAVRHRVTPDTEDRAPYIGTNKSAWSGAMPG